MSIGPMRQVSLCFVGNRIAEIQRVCSKHAARWMWVPGDQNPADIPSRGIWPLDENQTKLWMEGPEFLKTGNWPDQPAMERPDIEQRKVAVNVTQPKMVIFPHFDQPVYIQTNYVHI